jgi:hypothetical protein
VFTGFSMAGFGMSRYHLRRKERGWRRKLVINFSAGVLTAIVVLIFAVVKFTEGAWLVVVVGPILVFVLIRLNREYRAEDQVLENIGDRRAAGIAPRQPNYTRRVVLVLVDNIDLATLAALRYARSLRPTSLRAVHFVIDTAKANGLRERWVRFGQDIPFEMIDTPDRRLEHAAQELVRRETEQPGTQVMVVLPRRGFSPLIGRLLHDRTADKIAAAVSRIPNAAATIIPFDVESRVRVLEARQDDQAVPVNGTAQADVPARPDGVRGGAENPRAAVATAIRPGKATVEGRVVSLAIRPVEQNSVLAVDVFDGTSTVTALFYGRKQIPGVICGSTLRLHGTIGFKGDRPVMTNPMYELVSTGA